MTELCEYKGRSNELCLEMSMWVWIVCIDISQASDSKDAIKTFSQ